MQSKYQPKQKATLLLDDGTFYYGYAAGNIGTATGEICFNTAMTGYQETFTDPSYFGQIIVMNTCHIGNYGVDEEEYESKGVKIAGLICKKMNTGFSRKRAKHSLVDYLNQNKVISVSDFDTRAVVRHIRHKGTMNCIISSENKSIDQLKTELAKVPSMKGLELSSKVAIQSVQQFGDINAPYKVGLIDFGAKENMIRCLLERQCQVTLIPMTSSIDAILKLNLDGFLLSNGPGDPSAMIQQIKLVKDIVNLSKPVFGICLGHQLLAESQGVATFKMHNGHRGINHPVKNITTNKSEITSQNHGFAVDKKAVDDSNLLEITHLNLNDQTVEGFKLKNKPVFSVQYHPESCPGPLDARYLFDDFVENIKKSKQ